MMSGRYLLDTNIIIALFATEAAVIQQLREASEVFIPSVAVGELYYGVYKSRHINENLERITEFVARNVVLGCDAQTARSYGALKEGLRRKGRPLPENDVWIAALAKQHGLVLVSRDGHFAEVTDVEVEVW